LGFWQVIERRQVDDEQQPPDHMRLTWPLTGRSKEMRLIEAALSDRDCSGIVVCGPAGVGKSRIAREATTFAASIGCEVRWVVATSSARALPLGALSSCAGPAGGDSLQLVRDVIESLTFAPDGATVVVGVDDAPLLDDLSIFVVHQIVQRGAKVVCTVRDGETVPVGIQEVLKAGQFDRLELQPLSRDETDRLLSATLGGTLDLGAAVRLWELTRGNVLYLRNIVEQEVAAGRLVRLHGVWRWLGDPVVPPGLAELIESRIGALSTSVSDVVDALAVGEPIELAALTRITDPAAVEEADIRGLITLATVDAGVEVRVAHPLYGQIRRERAAPTRLRRLRGLVATELAKSDDCDDVRVVVRRATLSLDSDLQPDPDLLVRAARGAVWFPNLPLADRLADAAIRAGGAAEANFIRAHVLSWLGRGHEADAVLAGTRELTDADRGRLAFLRATNRLFVLADPAGAKRLIDDASHTAPGQARACIDAFLTVYWAAMGKPDAATQSSKTFALEELPDLVAARTTAWAITLACGDAGRVTEAVAAANAGYAVPMRSFVVLPDAHVGALLLAGRVAEAWQTAEGFRKAMAGPNDVCRHTTNFTGGPLGLAGGAAVLGRAARGAGRLSTACSLLGAVADALSAGDTANGWWYRCQIPLTIALAMRGLTDEAAAALAALEERCHPSWRCLDYEYAIARAWVAAAQGALSEAITTLLSAAETARANGQFAAEVMCLQTATQFGDPSGASRLAGLAAIVEGPRAGAAARFGAALAAGDSAALAAVSEDFERMGDLVAAVDAAAHAAMAYRGQGLRGSGLGCSARAQALAQRCGARTPALGEASEPLPLTDREREIVSLIGAGLSNRDIAARLTISVRTVETHIYNAMAKTGTAGREDLAALLPRPVGESFPAGGRAHYVGDTSDR
jgi:DNA-binding CsgD family transcriptional regulator